MPLPNLFAGLGLVQYPLRRTLKENVDTLAFLDGSEQRCATSRPLHQWTISLDLLDEQELGALAAFVEQQQGEAGRFEFTDPADGVLYANCSLAVSVMEQTFHREGRGSTVLVIRENPY